MLDQASLYGFRFKIIPHGLVKIKFFVVQDFDLRYDRQIPSVVSTIRPNRLR